MQIKAVDFIKSLLVKFARCPHLLQFIIHLVGIVLKKYGFELVKSLLRLVKGKHPKQMYLCRSKSCRVHKAMYVCFACKDKNYILMLLQR